MTDDPQKLSFTQRTGLEPLPPQLRLGEASAELRRLLHYAILLEVQRNISSGGYEGNPYFVGNWKRVASDFSVLHMKRAPNLYVFHGPSEVQRDVERILQHAAFGEVFNLVEFFLTHRHCSSEMRGEIADAFKASRAAYRVIDNRIAAVGTDEQATAFLRAM